MMKVFTLVSAMFIATAAYSQNYIQPENFGETVETLNQVTPDTTPEGEKIQSMEEPQDQQERLYWEQKAREDKQWQKEKQIDDYRFDVPGP